MAQSSRKTWVSGLVAGVISVGILAAAAVGGTAFFIYRHVQTQFTPSENAEQQFQDARARFGGQQPLLEVRHDDERPIVHHEVLAGRASTVKLESLRVLAYAQRARKLVNVSIPFWLLRLAPADNLSLLRAPGV